MSSLTDLFPLDVFEDLHQLEIFSLVTGCLSLAAVVILTIAVIHLYTLVNRLRRQVSLQTRMDMHSFHNPAIQPEEELARRGFHMYNGQQQDIIRPPDVPEKEMHFGSF